MYKETIKNTGDKMDKTIAVIQKDLATLRAGRANPQILDKITVDYYGSPTALNQVGNISSPEPRLLVIAPWEPSMITPIEKAIQKSDIGINPSNDGKVIRLLVPELTAERRKLGGHRVFAPVEIHSRRARTEEHEAAAQGRGRRKKVPACRKEATHDVRDQLVYQARAYAL